MDPRITIPAFALLGLHLTGWAAVDIEGDVFPLVEQDGEYPLRSEDTLLGHAPGEAQDEEHDAAITGGEYDGEAAVWHRAVADDRVAPTDLGLLADLIDDDDDRGAYDMDGLDPDERGFDEFERELGEADGPAHRRA